MADRFSDIEVTFLVDTLPPSEDCRAWLARAGAAVEPPEPDAVSPGCMLTKSWYRGVFVEAAWQTVASYAAEIRAALAAETDDHWLLTRVWHIVHAVPLRAGPHLAGWQRGLARYPDTLQERLIRRGVRMWADPHWYPVSAVNLWPLAHRGARFAVAARLLRETESALRVLFASNSVWEPDWKWLVPESRRLARTPGDLVARVDAIFALADPLRSATACLELIRDTLDLVPEHIDVTLQRRQVHEALEPEALLRAAAGRGWQGQPAPRR